MERRLPAARSLASGNYRLLQRLAANQDSDIFEHGLGREARQTRFGDRWLEKTFLRVGPLAVDRRWADC